MKTSTSFVPGQGGRAPGSRNRVTAEGKKLAATMVRSGELRPRDVLLALHSIALDPLARHADRIAASDRLLDRIYGKPPRELDVNIERSAPDVVALLEAIATSPRHRQALEEREARSLAPVIETTTKERPS